MLLTGVNIHKFVYNLWLGDNVPVIVYFSMDIFYLHHYKLYLNNEQIRKTYPEYY